ncbi:MAG: HEPN domain-containing protein [Candidatus Diapherotrites archaeon]
MINVEECLKQGLLKRIPASKQKAMQSIGKAEELLTEAEADLGDGRINSAVIVSYLALFHAARALLFKDGLTEKSHECVIRYLEEKYAKAKLLPETFIDLLDRFKAERSHTQYDVSYSPNEEDAEEMIEFCREFIEAVEKLANAQKR